MKELEGLKGKFRLAITIFVLSLILTTSFMVVFQSIEIDHTELDDEDDTKFSPLSNVDKDISSTSEVDEGLFLDTVDESESTGKHTSIDVKEYEDGKSVYVSYYAEGSQDLKLAQNDIDDPDRDWEIWTIDNESDVGRYSSLEVDRNSKAHIAYYDATESRLKYKLWCVENNRVERTDFVDDDPEVGKYVSLELVGDDNLGISYHDYDDGGLKYAEFDDNGWETFTVSDDGENLGRYTSLAFDSDSQPHITFYDWEKRDLKYAERSVRDGKKGWDVQTVEEAGELVGKYTSLELDQNDRAHISCYEWTEDYKRLKYVTNSNDDGDWISEMISKSDPSGTYTSIELYGSDNPLITYHEWGEENLRFAVKEDEEWKNVEIDTEGRVGSHTSLDYIGEAETHISYHDQGEGDLKHARYFFKNRTPLAPQHLTTSSEYGDVLLEWEPPAYDGIKTSGDHILGYHVYRSDGDGFEKIDNVTGLSYSDEIERQNETKAYDYRVAAVNRKGVGDNTSVIRTKARYFSYERALEKANRYQILEDGLLPIDEGEEGPYEIRWDLDHDPSEGPNWEESNYKEGMYKKYEEVGLKSVLLEYENSRGNKRRCLQSAWVLGEFELTSTYEETGSEEIFFHLPKDKEPFDYLGSEDALKNTYELKSQAGLPYEYIEFEFLKENHTADERYLEQNRDIWRKTLSVSDSSEDEDVRSIPYLRNDLRGEVESPIDFPHEIELKNEKHVDIIETPRWFPYLLDAFFGDDLEITNIEEDGDYTGWEVEYEIPEIDDEDELKDALEDIDISGTPELEILDDLERYFGGDYGFEMELFPDRDIVFDNDLNFETTLIEFYTDVDEDYMGVDDFDGELGNSLDYAADPEIEVSAGVSIDLIVKRGGVTVSGGLELEVGTGIQIDIPLKSIGFAEVGLTAEIGGEIGVEYEVGALDYEDKSGLSLDPGDSEVPIEFILNFGGGPYGEVGAGLARIEGKLILEVIVGLELPSKDTDIDHAGRFEVEVSAGWGLWSKTEEWELYSTEGDSTSMVRMDTDGITQNQMFTTDRLATRDYSIDENTSLLDSNGFEERNNVGPRADPQFESLDEENAFAVWSELSKDDGLIQSDLFMQKFSDGEWEYDVKEIPTEGDMAYDPKILPLELEDEIALIYKEIEERPDEIDSVEELEEYYTDDLLKGKSWCLDEEVWRDLDLNHSVENQSITSFDVVVDDQDEIQIIYRLGDPSLDIFESASSEEGEIVLLKQDDDEWVKNAVSEEKVHLPQTSRPSIEFVEGEGVALYTRTIQVEDEINGESCYNETVLVPIDRDMEEKIVRETPNTTSHHLLSEEDGNIVISWVENHTEIRRKVVGNSWDIPENYTTIHSKETVTGLSHHVNETGNFYVFQKERNAVPTVVESSGDQWSKERSILRDEIYAPNQLSADFVMDDPTMVLVEKKGVIGSWQRAHYTFDGSLSEGVVEDKISESNSGELKGNWTQEEHGTLNQYGRYGNYLTFDGEDSKMVVEHSPSLNVTEKTENFTLTSLLNINSTDNETRNSLMRKEGSWGVFLNQSKVEIGLWDDDGKHTVPTGIKFPSSWTFFALRYEEGGLNLTVRSYEENRSSVESTETILLEDFGSLTDSIQPLKIADGSEILSVDDFRLFNEYLPNASIEKINRTSYPSFDMEYSVTKEKIPPYVNFTYSEKPMVGEPVEFTAQSSHDDLNYSWSFEKDEQKYGTNIEYTFAETGYHTVTLKAEDKESGAKTRYERTLHIIDVFPPTFDGDLWIDEEYGENNSVKIKWEDAEGESEPFKYRIHHMIGKDEEFDHDHWRYSTRETSFFLENLTPDVKHHLQVSVENDLGLTNISSEFISFELQDDLPPEFSGLNSTYVDHAEKIVGLSWHEAEDPSGPVSYNIYHAHGKEAELNFEETLDTTQETEHEVQVSEIGKHHFAVRAEDDNGNEDSNEEVRNVELRDTESPEIDIISPSEGESLVAPVTIEWSAFDNNSGISTYWVKREDENWIEVDEQNYTFTNLPEGEMTLTVRAVDKYNNSAEDSIEIYIVTELKPAIDFHSPSPRDGAADLPVDIELSVDLEHEEKKNMDVSFYESNTAQRFGTDKNVSSGETASVELKGLEHNTTHEWYVEGFDGTYTYRSSVWNFTTSTIEYEDRSLEVNKEGNGTINIDPEQEEYADGTEINLTAIPEEGWSFKNWTGDIYSESKNLTIVMDNDKTITANFEIRKYNLTIEIEGEGSTDPEKGSHRYASGEKVILTSDPGEESRFNHWSGDIPEEMEEEKEITITMNEDIEIKAYFEEETEEEPEDEESIGVPAYLSSIQIILGVIFVGLVVILFVLYNRSEDKINWK